MCILYIEKTIDLRDDRCTHEYFIAWGECFFLCNYLDDDWTTVEKLKLNEDELLRLQYWDIPFVFFSFILS